MKLGYGYVRSNGLISIDVDVECVKEIIEIFSYKADGYVQGKRWTEASEAVQACKELQDLIEEAKKKEEDQAISDAHDTAIVDELMSFLDGNTGETKWTEKKDS